MRPFWTRAPLLVAVLCSLFLVSCFGGHGGGGGGGNGGGGGGGGNGNGGGGTNNNPVFAIDVADSGNFQQGSKNVTYTIDVTNTGKLATSGNVEADVTLPAGESFVSVSGSGGAQGWAFTGGQIVKATRADSLAPGASFPIFTITVNVSLYATSPQVLMATVSGGGAATANNQDSTAILTHVSILLGRYAFLFSGFDGNGAVAIAGSFNVDVNGNVTGKEDFKDPSVVQPGQQVAGFCQNLAIASAGFCKLTAGGRTSQYDFVLRNNETVARFAEDTMADGVANTGSGVLIAQTVTTQNALTSAGGFNGFFSIGFDGTNAAGGRMALEGTIFTNLSGAVAAQGGILPQADVNDNGTLIQPANSTTANVTGNFTPVGTATVDSFGRATMTMTIGTAPSSKTLTLALYILAPQTPFSNQSGRAFAVDITPVPANSTSQVLSGQFFWLGNPSPLPFSNSSISGVNVFALGGVVPGAPAASNTLIGALTATTAQNGQVLLDVNTAGTVNGGAGIGKPLTGTYTLGTVAANGRVVLTVTIGMTNYTYVLYLDADNDGNALETGGDSTVSFGFFTGQASTNVFNGARTYVIGTVDPVLATVTNFVSPITLTPGASGSGTFSTGSVSGTYAIDLTTGRGTSVATSGNVPPNPHSVLYVIAPNLAVLMGADQGVTNDAISLIQF